MPFPPLSWWMTVQRSRKVVWDVHEHYEKMSRRSRYRIATAQGVAQLSIPLLGGRDQRAAMCDLLIDNRQPWARTHWRTLTAAYNRAPFFEHFAGSLQALYTQPFEHLAAFNRASVAWLCRALRVDFSEEESVVYELEPIGAFDLRDERLQELEAAMEFPVYTQVFGERHDFLPNLSVLDWLFTQGPGLPQPAKG